MHTCSHYLATHDPALRLLQARNSLCIIPLPATVHRKGRLMPQGLDRGRNVGMANVGEEGEEDDDEDEDDDDDDEEEEDDNDDDEE